MSTSFDSRLDKEEVRFLVRNIKRTMNLDERALFRAESRARSAKRSVHREHELRRNIADADAIRTKLMNAIA